MTRWARLVRVLCRRVNGRAADKEAQAQARYRAAQRMTPVIEHLAPRMADVPPDEFARRVYEAFGRRSV